MQHRFQHACVDADIALIERVMGLFDGSSHDSLQGSSAEIALWLATPLSGADIEARSFAAIEAELSAADLDLQEW